MGLIFFWTNSAAIYTDPIAFLLTIQDLTSFTPDFIFWHDSDSLDMTPVDPGIDLVKRLVVDNNLGPALNECN